MEDKSECIICIEIKDNIIYDSRDGIKKQINNFFTCNACRFTNCIDCHKRYLLTSTHLPHCMNTSCRSAIPYDMLLRDFNDNKWLFTTYKDHRSNILLNQEKSYIPEMVQEFAIQKDIELKKREFIKDINELRRQIREIETKINELTPAKMDKTKYQYNYGCPKEECKGFLDSNFNCGLCNSVVCHKCYEVLDGTKKGVHECDPEKVETFNMIKKEAKPCPQCGEFISKVSGCDQMFCIKCSCAFSYNTGIIEKGIIHNPLAYDYFQKNPDAQEAYLNRIRGGGETENGNCRTPIPSLHHIQPFIILGQPNFDYIRAVHRYISEFRQYRRDSYMRFLNNNNNKEENRDIRIKYLNNHYTDKMFKSVLHKREKKIFFLKQLYPLVIFSYEFAESILWTMVDILNKYKEVEKAKIIGIRREGLQQLYKNVELLKEFAEQTQNNITYLKDDFNYTRQCIFPKNYNFYHN
jgi:hypothetical protein